MRPLPDWQKSDRAPTPRWRIFRIWGGAKAFIGIVAAADQEKCDHERERLIRSGGGNRSN